MDFKKLVKKTRFSILANTMSDLGLDPDEVYDSVSAIEAIYNKLKVDNQELDFECNKCGADIPDVDSCPICGSSFDEDEGVGQSYIGARRGRRPRRYRGITGVGLFRLLLNAFGISRRYVRWKKTVVSIWSENQNGMLARCFIGAYSVRFELPYGSERYDGYVSKIYDYKRPKKNMCSRIVLQAEDDVDGVVSVLKQTEVMKAATEKRKYRKKPIPPVIKIKTKPIRVRRIKDSEIPDFSDLE